ncbi:MAG TPA: flagellin [Stellaceae bacterium]|nr:flagellin [Stellaceae bacterium]
MTRISTAAENNLVLYYMNQNQSNLDNLNTQISTGDTAQTYSQIPQQTSQLVDLRAETAQQQGFTNTINVLSTRMQTMSLSLQQIETSVSSFAALLPGAAFGVSNPTISQQAEGLLQQVAGYLNVQDGSGYVFGGTDTSTPPVDLSALPTATASLTTPVNGPPSSGGYYAGGPASAAVQINTGVSVNYSITANNAQAFEPIIRVLNFLANQGPFNPNNPAAQAAASQAGQLLNQAVSALTGLQGDLGLQQAQLGNELKVQQNTVNIAQNGISSIVATNQATAITQLQTLETQLQASFSATSAISKLSLVSYLG